MIRLAADLIARFVVALLLGVLVDFMTDRAPGLTTLLTVAAFAALAWKFWPRRNH
jgi:hypothetical protein